MNYACRKCSTPERPTKARLVVWSRELGYLCASCAGTPVEPRGAGPFGAFTPNQVRTALSQVVEPTNRVKSILDSEPVAQTARFEDRKRKYTGPRLPHDPKAQS